MRWRCVCLCVLALCDAVVRARLGKKDIQSWVSNIIPKKCQLHVFFLLWCHLQLTTTSAASVAHGAGSTSRPLTAMCTSSPVCASTTWSPTATSPSRSSQCTSGGKSWTETLQSAMWWSTSMTFLSASPETGSLSTTFREPPPVVAATQIFLRLRFWSDQYVCLLGSKCRITTQGSRWKETLSTSSCSLKSALWSCGTATMPLW